MTTANNNSNNNSDSNVVLGSSPRSVVVTPTDKDMKELKLTRTQQHHRHHHHKEEKPWPILPASAKSQRTKNPIRAIVDPIAANIKSGVERGDGKDHISLALGDPTAAGNLPPCPAALEAVEAALKSHSHAAGYVNASGLLEARQAIADFHSLSDPNSVIVANGCSGALEIALTALLDPGTILLVPKPGFPLYQVIAESHGANVVHYNLLPENNWEIDLYHLEELVLTHDSRIRGILVNNPSNPTGGVFSRKHLESLAKFAQRYRLPIVADEVYGDLTFGDHTFHPMADVATNLGREVPVITASGLGKQFLVPGWRVGWLAFQDNFLGSLADVEAGAKRLAQVILGASHPVQSAIPVLLNPKNTKVHEWKSKIQKILEGQATFLCNRLEECPGLNVMRPQGAMYAIVRIDIHKFGDSIASDLDFTSKLLKEENVFVLPGSAFGVPGLFRVVFCAPEQVLQVASERIRNFCVRHSA